MTPELAALLARCRATSAEVARLRAPEPAPKATAPPAFLGVNALVKATGAHKSTVRRWHAGAIMPHIRHRAAIEAWAGDDPDRAWALRLRYHTETITQQTLSLASRCGVGVRMVYRWRTGSLPHVRYHAAILAWAGDDPGRAWAAEIIRRPRRISAPGHGYVVLARHLGESKSRADQWRHGSPAPAEFRARIEAWIAVAPELRAWAGRIRYRGD
jgi:hypothetical protein